MDVDLVCTDELTSGEAERLGVDARTVSVPSSGLLPGDPFTASIVAFHEHEKEMPLLPKLLEGSDFYVAAIGSARVGDQRAPGPCRLRRYAGADRVPAHAPGSHSKRPQCHRAGLRHRVGNPEIGTRAGTGRLDPPRRQRRFRHARHHTGRDQERSQSQRPVPGAARRLGRRSRRRRPRHQSVRPCGAGSGAAPA